MLISQRRQLYSAAAIVVAAGLVTVIVFVYLTRIKAAKSVSITSAKASYVSEYSPPDKTSAAVPKLTAAVKAAVPKLAAPLDEPYVHGGFLVSFSKPERRQNEHEKTWGYRVQFIDQYQRFVNEAKIGPVQENAIRGIFADAQIALQQSYHVIYPEEEREEPNWTKNYKAQDRS
jgi:hypothetical protein